MPPRQAAAAPHRARDACDASVGLSCAGLPTTTMLAHPSTPGRDGRSKGHVYSPNIIALDFSHLAAQQTASSNGSINALRLSSGWCARATRKKSLTFTDCLLVRTRRQSCSGRPPKGYPQGEGPRSLRVAYFRALRPSWTRAETESTGASRAPAL